jgi:hypothetical protein
MLPTTTRAEADEREATAHVAYAPISASRQCGLKRLTYREPCFMNLHASLKEGKWIPPQMCGMTGTPHSPTAPISQGTMHRRALSRGKLSPPKRPILVSTILLLAAVTATEPARALDIHVTATVHPGRLTLDTARGVISGAERMHGLHRVLITVTDARGRGDGWQLNVRPTNTTNEETAVVGIDIRCGHRSTCTLPRDFLSLPADLAANRRTPVLEAEKGTGMGRIEVTLTIATVNDEPALTFSLRPA